MSKETTLNHLSNITIFLLLVGGGVLWFYGYLFMDSDPNYKVMAFAMSLIVWGQIFDNWRDQRVIRDLKLRLSKHEPHDRLN